MSEPKYDEDVVNLGYLKKLINNETCNTGDTTISKHYASKPTPPYYAGDTWIDGNNLYTCVNTRLIGPYTDSDWTTESGAKEEVESKNRIYLTQPSNYNIGDMWILQSDNDHKAGKKGEILISTVKRQTYDEGDWINMLGYGTIRSINEVANNISDALERIGVTKTSGKITIFYDDKIPETAIKDDLWYVTDNLDDYIAENVYKYDGNTWEKVEDSLSVVAFEEANEARLVNDGKIQSFYSETEPTENLGVGDIWKDKTTNKLYRYNGTNWVSVYNTNLNEIRENIETITTITTELSTDLGSVVATVSETETRLNNDYLTAEQIEAENSTIKEDIDVIKQQQATAELTSKGLQIQIDTINNEGVKTVKNTTVDINEDGVTVGKSDSEFSTNMNNTGTYMYAYGRQIAKYDKDGVETANFKATGEVELGYLKLIKAEVNSEKRTHIHWIGG